MQELEHLVTTGADLAAARRFERLLRAGTLAGRDLAQAYHLGGQAYYRRGNLLAACRCAERASALACALGDEALRLQVERNLPAYCLGLGNLPEAIACAQQWLADAARASLPALDTAPVHCDLAQGYLAGRQPEAARMHVDQALPYLREAHDQARLFQALAVAAWSCFDLGLASEADGYAAEATAVVVDAPEVGAQRELTLLAAYRHVLTGRYGEATAQCELLLLQPDLPYSQRFKAAWVLCTAAVREVEETGAESLHEVALHLSALVMDLAIRLRRDDLVAQAQRLRQEAVLAV
jgi:tetratricopeptide (TPR) repeat protein